MEKVTVWGSATDAGDGSGYISWFLTEEQAAKEQQEQCDNGEGFGSPCYERVETFVGSNIHEEAKRQAIG